MSVTAITSVDSKSSKDYVDAIERAGGTARVLLPHEGVGDSDASPRSLLAGIDGLVLPGGPDVEPELYGEATDPSAEVRVCTGLDQLEFNALEEALDRNLPVLAICRGMQVLNVAFGGKLLQDIPNHRCDYRDGKRQSAFHQIYLSPGSKLAAILGVGGFFRVNSLHHQGLRDAQRASRLLASAYSLDDGVIEGLESPEHDWVVGVQCHPERQDEVPKSFANLFISFVERVEKRRNQSSCALIGGT